MFRTTALLCLLLSTSVASGGENVVVVLDDSGSMSDRMRGDRSLRKMEAAKRALLTVLRELPADAQVGIVLLNGREGAGHWAYPLGPVDTEMLVPRIQRISPNGITPLGERLKTGADAILALRAKQHYGSFRLLVVTDGEANDEELVEAYLPDILSRGIWVDVIGVDMAADHSLATKVHTYRKADDPNSLEQAIAEVFAESTDAGSDADESDFELIAAIPSELAAAALKALSTSSNHPIGEKPTPVVDASGAIAVDGDARPVYQQPAPGPSTVATPSACAGFVSCGMFVGILVVAGVLLVLFTAKRRK